MRGNWNPCWSKTQHQDKIKMSKDKNQPKNNYKGKYRLIETENGIPNVRCTLNSHFFNY